MSERTFYENLDDEELDRMDELWRNTPKPPGNWRCPTCRCPPKCGCCREGICFCQYGLTGPA